MSYPCPVSTFHRPHTHNLAVPGNIDRPEINDITRLIRRNAKIKS